MAYSSTEKDFVRHVEGRNVKKFRELYLQPFINYEGAAKDTERSWQDIAADLIASGAVDFNPSPLPASSEDPVSAPFHSLRSPESLGYVHGRFVGDDEKISRRIFEKGYPIYVFGEKCVPCDYQVPVCNRSGSVDGNINLVFSSVCYEIPDFLPDLSEEDLSESDDPFCRYLLSIMKNAKKASRSIVLASMKTPGNEDSLLRAALEIETYFRKTPHERLRACYDRERFKKALILFDGSRAASEYFSFGFRSVKSLVERWSIAVITAREIYSDMEPDFNEYELSSIPHIYSSYKTQAVGRI